MVRMQPGEAEPAQRRRATSQDVARLAGTSRATVSYVLNRVPGITISPGTRERVLAAARELNYVPSLAAQSLAAGGSNVLLLMLPDTQLSSFIVALIHSLQRACRAAGIVLTAYFSGPDETDPEKLGIATMAQTLLALHPLSEQQQTAFDALGIRTLSPDAADPAHRLDLVTQVLAWAGRRQVEYLADRGHRRLAYIAPDDARREPFSAPRRAGVQLACRELGLPEPLLVRVPPGVLTAADIEPLVTAQVDGVCAYNDDVALAVRNAFAQHEPDIEIGVVGGNNQPYAALLDPPLPTVRIDTDAFAATLIEQVVSGNPVADPSGMVQVGDGRGVAT